MKKYAFLLIIPLFFACGPSEEELKLQAKIDSLTQVTGADGATINEYMKSFNEIQANLDDIKSKEKIISKKTSGDVELNQTDKDQINADIMTIYEMMSENKKQLATLRSKLKKSNTKVAEFEKTIARLTEEMSQKEGQLTELKAVLEKKDFDIAALNVKISEMDKNVADLSSENDTKKELIEKQDKELNTAYFVVGSKKDLKEKGITSKEGGFIGMGGDKKVHLNAKEFKEIDIRELKDIEINAGKATLITDHPTSSYKFVMSEKGDVQSITITDYAEFWKMSKYLVIETR